MKASKGLPRITCHNTVVAIRGSPANFEGTIHTERQINELPIAHKTSLPLVKGNGKSPFDSLYERSDATHHDDNNSPKLMIRQNQPTFELVRTTTGYQLKTSGKE